MQLRELELRNICQHKHLLWKFKPGLTGIFGPNGSGKSNAINIGCYATLTNDFGRNPWPREKNIRQTAREEEPAFSRLKAIANGTEFILERHLRPDKHKLLIQGHEKPITKAGEITKELEDTLGISRQVIDNYLFVNQWQLFDFLSVQPAKRAQNLAQLCGTTVAEDLWNMLGDQIEADRSLAAEVVDTSDEIRRKIGEQKTTLREARAELKEAKLKLATAEQLAAWKALIKRAEKYDEISADLTAADTKLKETKDKAIKTQTAYKNAVLGRDAMLSQYETAKTAADDASVQLKNYEAASKPWKDRQRLGEQLKTLNDNKPKFEEEPPYKVPLATVQQRLRRLKRAKRRCERLLAHFDKDGVVNCPTCGTAVEQFAEKVAVARISLPLHARGILKLQSKVKLWEDYEERKNASIRAENSWHTRMATLREMYELVKEAQPPAAVDEVSLKALVKKAADLKKTVDTDTEDCNTKLRAKETAASNYRAAQARQAELESKLEEHTVDDEELAVVVADSDAHHAAELVVAGCQVKVDTAIKAITEREEELEQIQTVMRRSSRARSWLELLHPVRNVMHRNNLPQLVHRNELMQMEDKINETLELFDSPFSVTPNNELGFTAYFPNGRVIDAAGLSGGEKGVLALAFRWTVHSQFAAQIDMMVLDEPTVGLDETNRDFLAKALVRLGAMAKSHGRQIIMVTHDKELERVFEHKLILGKAA